MHLPHRDQDAVLTLYAHYFLSAKLMRENYAKLKLKRINRLGLCQDDEVHEGIYFFTWLGFLGVTCEGYRSLSMRLLLQNERPKAFKEIIGKSDEIGRLMKRHLDLLREVRNKVFHLREDLLAINKFFAEGSTCVSWAEELSDALDEFFSTYRIVCEVFYLTNDRHSESQAFLEKQRKRVKKLPQLQSREED